MLNPTISCSWIFITSHLHAWKYNDIVRRNSSLVTHGIKRVNTNYFYKWMTTLIILLLKIYYHCYYYCYYYYYHHYYSLHVKSVFIGQIIHLQLIFVKEFRCVRLHNKCNVTIQNYLWISTLNFQSFLSMFS